MTIQEQAIKIELLKQERDKKYDDSLVEILRISRIIDDITNEIFNLQNKRAHLFEKLLELNKKRKRDHAHFNLMIEAHQSLNNSKQSVGKNTMENKQK